MAERLYKVCVVGDVGVGKTSFTKKLVHDLFSIHYKSTIGVDFSLKVIKEVINEQEVTSRIQLWDFAGNERHGNMTNVYYKGAVGAFILCDAPRPNTLDGAKRWKQDLDKKLSLDMYKETTCPFILLICKSDLVDEIDITLYDNFCLENNIHSWLAISNKNGDNVNNAINVMHNIIKTSIPMIHENPTMTTNIVGLLPTLVEENKELKKERIEKEQKDKNHKSCQSILDSIIKITVFNESSDVKINAIILFMHEMYNNNFKLSCLDYKDSKIIKCIHDIIIDSSNNNDKCNNLQSVILTYDYNNNLGL